MECTCPKCGLVWNVTSEDEQCECFGIEIEGEERGIIGCGHVFTIDLYNVMGE